MQPKKITKLDKYAIYIAENLSVSAVVNFVVFFIGLNMLFPRVGQTAALIYLAADEFNIPLPVGGLIIIASAFVSLDFKTAWKARLIAVFLFWLFIFSIYFVTWKYNYSWQGAIIYTGYGILRVYVLIRDYVRDIDEDESIRLAD